MPLTQPPHHRTLSPQEEELQELLAELQRGLDGLAKGKLNATAKSERIAELSSRLQRAKQVLHSFKVELRDLARDRTAEFDIKAREFNQRVQTMQGELQHAKQEAERAQVGVKTLDEMTTQEVLQEAGKVQDQSLGALSRMKQQIAQTKEVGATTAVQLKAQTEQLKNIDTDIMKVKSNLTRADLLVRAFMRKIMTDKIIMSELAPARVRHQRREGRATRMGSGGPPCAGRLWRAPRQAPSACPAVARRASAIARVGYRARRLSRASLIARVCASCVVARVCLVRRGAALGRASRSLHVPDLPRGHRDCRVQARGPGWRRRWRWRGRRADLDRGRAQSASSWSRRVAVAREGVAQKVAHSSASLWLTPLRSRTMH